MTAGHRGVLVVATFLLAWLGAGSRATAGEPSGWLDVRECGASGSAFETTATTTAGSNAIVVKDVGDFQVGQGVIVSRCAIRCGEPAVWGAGPANFNIKPPAQSIELRGYDGSGDGWQVYLLDVAPGPTSAFRWSNDLGRTWHDGPAITHDWQPIERGIEVRFDPKRDWPSGYTVAFSARDQLETQIVKIEGNTLTLKEGANRAVGDAVVRHSDTLALQAAVNRAVREKLNVRIPAGHYRLSRGIRVEQPSAIIIEGQNAVDTVLDISNGQGACITLAGGTDVTIRNLRMVGFMGFDQRDQAGIRLTRGAPGGLWGFQVKSCRALVIGGTERALVENCHASRMSSECFVSHSRSRATATPEYPYSKSTTYLRCSVTDCARNAFNDTHCGSENTSVLGCRIVDVGGCAWEGASRFVKFTGNYVRNAGTVAMGNLGPGNRDRSFDTLGAGQHIVADNVFEDIVPYGGCAVRASVGATQVIIRNNLFVNFGSSAIEASGVTTPVLFPASNVSITGNILDMTCVGRKPVARTAIASTLDDVIIADNQIYVRGGCDPTVTAIALHEPAVNVNVHDNLVRDCGRGIAAVRAKGSVATVVDPQTFTRTEEWTAGLPLDRRNPQRCRGWSLVWLDGEKPNGTSTIASFDPETLQFTLDAPREMKPKDRFEVYPPSAQWMVHDNTVVGCLHPIVLDGYGSPTSIIRNNLISRGGARDVARAVNINGQFYFLDNHISGFDEKDSAAIGWAADPLGRVAASVFRNNIFERCTRVVHEAQQALWDQINTE